jgi:hypothetical protein
MCHAGRGYLINESSTKYKAQSTKHKAHSDVTAQNQNTKYKISSKLKAQSSKLTRAQNLSVNLYKLV